MHQGLLLTLSLAVGSSFVSALIADDCTNLRLQNNWLIGNCLTGTGTQRIQSSVYIGNKLTNREGSLLVCYINISSLLISSNVANDHPVVFA